MGRASRQPAGKPEPPLGSRDLQLKVPHCQDQPAESLFEVCYLCAGDASGDISEIQP